MTREKYGKITRKHFLSFACIFIALFVNACSGQNTGGNAKNTSPIKIGYSVPLTGDFSVDGPLLQEGYRLWAKEVNAHGGLLGRQVQLIGKDDASKPAQATTDYTNLISQDHVDLLFAPITEDLTLPGAIVAHRYGKILVEGASTEQDVYLHGLDNLFAVSLPAQKYVSTFASYILALPSATRPTTAAYLTLDDFFTKPQIAEAQNLLENNGQSGGLKTVLSQTFGAETTNYNTLAAQVVQSGAQVVVLGTEDVPSVSAFIKYFRSHHYNPEAIIATSGPDAGDTFLQAIGNGNAKDLTFEDRMAEGIFIPNDGWYPTIKNYQNDTFVQAWLAANPGQTPDGISSDDVQAFSSAQVLQQAIEATHSIDNSVLKAYMHAGHTFKSLQGSVQFDAQGRNILSNPFLFQWQNGHLIPVYPASVAEATPEFPKHAWP